MNGDVASALTHASTTGTFEFYDEHLDELPEQLREIPHLREISVPGCNISTLPDWLAEFHQLTRLELGRTQLSDLPSVLGELSSLRELGMSSLPLGELGEQFAKLTNLEVLVVPGNGVTYVPPWISNLRRLRMLDLGGNPLLGVPAELGALQHLTHLFIWGHSLREFPDALRSLHRLELLELSQGGTHDLPGQRMQAPTSQVPFTRLIGQAYTVNGEISSLPEWMAEAFPSLRQLYLGGQTLRSLPGRLPESLEELYLAGNRLTSFPPSVRHLPNLRRLDLRRNNLNALPAGPLVSDSLTYLDLVDNPLPIPPEVLADTKDPFGLFGYAARVRGPTKPLDQAKLLVVGEGSVGKTSLIKRLVRDEFSPYEQKTEGIDVSRWGVAVNGNAIVLNVWDFGGQEIMHATHQFFLTRRSLYVLVIDARQGEEQNRVEYWLKLVQGFSDASPVIIVANKSEQSALDIDTRGLKAKYPNIAAIVSVSCKTGEGIDAVRSVLADSLGNMPHVRDLLPAAFFDVKHDLENLDANYLGYGEYEALCQGHGVTEESEQELLVGFLHDLGTVLCFREDPRLSDTNILNPEWVTGGVYRLLNSHLASQRKGLLDWSDVDQILDSPAYPPARRPFIVDMMKRFELCYESDDVFLVPDLLTKEEPDTGSWDDALQFEVRYDVLPSSILSRLIVRMHTAISKSTVWRTGLVVALDANRALVKGDREDAVVRIAVVGPADGRRGLLSAIRSELRSIEGTIPGLVSEERVPVPGHANVWVPYSHLLDLEAAGRDVVVPQGLTEDFRIRDLLAGVEAPTERQAGRLVIHESPSSEPTSDPQTKEARAWSPSDAMGLGRLLLVGFVAVLAILVGAYAAAGAAAAGLAGAATIALVAVAVVVLRSSGRISEEGFVATVQEIMRRK